MSAPRIAVRSASAIVAAAVLATAWAWPAAADEMGSPLEEPTPSASANPASAALGAYGGNPTKEAQLVAQEDRRLIDVSLVASGILVPGLDTSLPFRVTGKPVSTLVLPARESAYTERDLQTLAPLTFVETRPGEFLLSENVVVLRGATLDLRRPGGMTIRLASQDDGFASIVVDGGNLVVEGKPSEEVTFEGWDSQRSEPDTNTADGRAYIRVIGGYASITNATFSTLGFWSGQTGGLSLTGTQVASTLGLSGDDAEPVIPEVHLAAPDTAQTVEGGDPVVVDGTAEGETGVDLTQGVGLYSTGVTAWLSGITVHGDAYGLFVSDGTSVEVQNSTFTDNLVDGVVFHREVVNSRIMNVTSSGNNGDGFRVTRGSQNVMLDTVVSTNNGGAGITLDGSPLADGPSATGLPVASYGGHTVVNSRVTNNGRYGIAVLGGDNVSVMRNTIEGSEFGLLASKGAQHVTFQDNRVTAPLKQGIAFRDSSQGEVSGNIVDGGEIGVYARDSKIAVARNTIRNVDSHGVTFVGETTGSVVAQNIIDGQGNSPVDAVRASGVTRLDNDTSSWIYQNLTERILRVVTRPMTLLWSILAVILLLTAFSGFRASGSGFGSPYKDRAPLHHLTRGVVDPGTVPGVVTPLEVELREAQEVFGPGQLPRRKPPQHSHESVTA